MYQSVRGFIADNSGVTVIEYALIAMLIGIVFIIILGTIATNLGTVFTAVGTSV